MSKLTKTSKLVKAILTQYEECRNSDDVLYLAVLKILKVNTQMSVDLFFKSREKLKVPPFESVRRARQKLQAHYPELRASVDVREYRARNEEAYEKFARGAV